MNSLFKAIGLASIANAIQLTSTNQLDAEVEAYAVPHLPLISLTGNFRFPTAPLAAFPQAMPLK
jgi:hypothetical protein